MTLTEEITTTGVVGTTETEGQTLGDYLPKNKLGKNRQEFLMRLKENLSLLLDDNQEEASI